MLPGRSRCGALQSHVAVMTSHGLNCAVELLRLGPVLCACSVGCTLASAPLLLPCSCLTFTVVNHSAEYGQHCPGACCQGTRVPMVQQSCRDTMQMLHSFRCTHCAAVG